ncbi:MAG: BatD family protein [Enhygromyxa sp.]
MSARASRRRFLQLAGASSLALALAGVPAPAEAAEVEVTATLGSSRVEVGRSVYLQVEVATDGGAIGQPRFVGLDGVEVSARGTSSGTSIQIGGGQRVQRSTKTFTYVLSPRRPGEFEIDVEVEVGGKLRRPASKPKLTATGEPVESLVEEGKAGDQPEDASAEVIVWPVVDKAKVYVGEQIVYQLQIWDRSNGNLSITSAPTFKDFWSEDLLPDERSRRRLQERKLVSGVPYRVHHAVRRALFPQKAGTLTIGGPEVQMQPMAGLFGGGGPPRTFVGRSLAVEVLPLPAEGQPANFRANNVGQLRISANIDRSALRQGEAVRLTIRVTGAGNIALIELPELPEAPGLRSYDPKPQTPKFEISRGKLEGSRVFSVLLVANEAGELTIPAIELPYFDPSTARYEVAKTEPITLQVEPNPDAVPSPSETRSAPDERDDELLASPIAGGELPRTTPRAPWLTRERWWTGTLAVPGLIGLGWVAGRLLRRFGPDEHSRARSKELARRRTLLAEASAAVEAGDGFYPTLATLLQTAAVGRAGPEGVGLTRDRLMRLLTERGVPSDDIATLRELLDASDAARFGSGEGNVDQRRAHLEQARNLIGKRGWGPS